MQVNCNLPAIREEAATPHHKDKVTVNVKVTGGVRVNFAVLYSYGTKYYTYLYYM